MYKEDFNTKLLGNAINSVVKSLSKSPNFSSLTKIFRNWSNVVDERFRKYCYPLKVVTDITRKSGKLIVVSNNPMASFYINNNKNYILSRINTYFGYNSIVSIQVREIPIIISDVYIKKQKKELTKEQQERIDNIVDNGNLSKSIKNLLYTYYSY